MIEVRAEQSKTHILGLDITMHNAHGVEVLESTHNLHERLAKRGAGATDMQGIIHDISQSIFLQQFDFENFQIRLSHTCTKV